MAANTLGLNQIFPIYNEDGTSFHDLVLRKGVADSIVMSLGDKITGDVFYKDNTLQVTMKEYIEYKHNPDDENEEPIRYSLVNPPTIVREGMAADNSELKGMTKYSFEFYHPMYQLSNFPFTDVATKTGEEKYLSQNKTFSWIGKPQDYFDKLNKNLQGTVWHVRKSDRFPTEKNNELSEVQQFDKISIAEAIKRGYEIWGVPYIVSQLPQTDQLYSQGKRFVVEYGLPSNEIYESDSARQLDSPFVFHMGQGVGLKNNSRTPRNNKIITRISGSGSESNIPYGYPQIIWYGNQDWDYTINNNPNDPNSYPIYKGIVGGQYVKLIKHPFTRTHLMPSIYSQTVFNKVSPYLSNGQTNPSYSPATEIKDYYDAIATQEYHYTNEVNPQAPSYESHEFEDIKPEFDSSESMGIVSAIPLNADLTPADHWDDSMDDDGNYLQSYFQITLPQLDFDLYACAAITQEMQINMRSGYCIGCTFPIQVDWDDYKKNFYDDDGNFVPDGEQRDLTKYPKSNLGQINVVVQKDNSTFGTLMPNIYQQPNANDLFVFIGISLPLSYITNAEERLDDAMKTYMLENNVFYFDYPLKFDEHFLATHTYILEQIRPNSIIRFDYGGVEQQLFVKQLTVKYGNAPLPQYDITLTDNIEVVLNQIGQVADDVEKLSSLISVLRQSYSRNVWNELAKKLSKTQDDTAQGYIRFLKGLQVGSNFVPDILGEGGVLRMRDDGKVELVTDILYARVKAYFDTVEIREYKHTAGNRIASVAGNKCVRVAWFNSSNVELEQTQANLSSVAYFRCFFRASDGEDTVRNNFSIGDQAYCHVTSIATGSDNPEEKGLNQKHFWRLVIGRNTEGTLTEDGEAYIDLSNRASETIGGASYEGYQSGSDVPQPQDDIIQLGNVNDTTRQGAIVEYVTGTDAPSYQIYQGINSFSLNGKNQIGLGYNTATGRAYMNVYGDFRFGSRSNNGSYIKYNSQTGNLEIKAHVEFTNSDAELDTLVQEHQRDDSYDDSWIQPAIDELQDQIDGELDTWYYAGVPTLNNLPASQWNTEELKNDHVGDLYYDKNTGYAYRFVYDSDSNMYLWTQIHDDAISEALRIANNAQDTADNKRRVFVRQPLASEAYDVGDLWVNATYSDANVTYSNEVLRCNQSKAVNVAFSISHWEKASKYTDDTYAHGFDFLASNLARLSSTEISGGLVLSSLIGLRDMDNLIQSGINGIVESAKKGNGIAAWYGGEQGDLEDQSHYTDITRWAKSLFRFDGSGYLASGNITWDKDGIVTIANVYSDVNGQPVPWSGATLQYITNLSTSLPITIQSGTTYLDPQVGFTKLSVLGETVATQSWVTTQIGTLEYLNQASGEDGVLSLITNKGNATLIDLTHEHSWFEIQDRPTTLKGYGISADDELLMENFLTIAFFNRLFQAHNGNADVNANDMSSTIDSIEAMFGFWTEQYISALGQSSGGGSGIGDVTWETLADNTDTRQIALSHLTTALAAYATQSWVTALLSSYATQSWVTTQLASYATQQWVISQGYTTNVGTVTSLTAGTGLSGGTITVSGTISISSEYQGYISNGNTAYGWGNHATFGYATVAQLNALEFLNQVSGGDGLITLTTNKSNSTVLDLTHQHSWFEIQDRPTTILGYGITDGVFTGSVTIGSNELNTNYRLTVNGNTRTNRLYLTDSVYLEYNSTTGGVHVVGAGLYSDTFISALGASTGTAGGIGDVTWEALASNSDSRQIAASHLSNVMAAYLPLSAGGSYPLTGDLYIRPGVTSDVILNVGGITIKSRYVGSRRLFYGDINGAGFLSLIARYGVGVFSDDNGTYTDILAGSFVKSGGTSTQFLKADGSVDEFTGGNGVLTLSGSGTQIDLTHQHSWFEIQDKPDTFQGFGIKGGTLTGNLQFAYGQGIYLGSDNYSYIKRNNGGGLLIISETIIIGDYNNRKYTSIVNDLQGGTIGADYNEAALTQMWYILQDGTAQFKSVSQTSDLRKKTIMGDVPINLYNVANAPLFKFTWKDEKKYSGQHIGSAAQYWQTVLPELVSIGRDTEQTLAMQYDVIALASVITVAKTVVSHEERITILEKENEALRKEIEKLKAA